MMKTALVVEDDPTIRLVLRTNLENDGLRVLEAETAEAALVISQDEVPDIVLVDLRLPGIHGFDLVRSLRARSEVPIIIVTAKPWVRLVRNPVSFTALHIYPLIAVALYPGGSWWWGLGWYAATLAAVIVVARIVPGYLQRPTAMAVFVLAVPIALEFPGPPGWSWLPPILLAKLLLAHAVHEEAYRP